MNISAKRRGTANIQHTIKIFFFILDSHFFPHRPRVYQAYNALAFATPVPLPTIKVKKSADFLSNTYHQVTQI